MYLKIENKGVAPTEGFTMFGATTKRDSTNNLTIGTFGSGSKHSLGVLLRAGFVPVIFCGKTKMEFFAEAIKIRTSTDRDTDHRQVCCRLSGKLPDGSTVNRTEKLSFTLDYGTHDWPDIGMALREFVSNAIDGQIDATNDFDGVIVEPVGDNQVRAKDGVTRVFIQMNQEVTQFYNDIGKWFLHFSNPQAVREHTSVLPKISKLENEQQARIYRRGVYVRSILHGINASRSLYDYNLEIVLNESRTFDDWGAQTAVAKALSFSSADIISNVMIACIKDEKIWEAGISEYSLCSLSYENEKDAARQAQWTLALEQILGDHGVLCAQHDMISDMIERKGYRPTVCASHSWLEAARKFGARTDTAVLTDSDRKGRVFSPPTAKVLAARDQVWKMFEDCGLTNGKAKPMAGCFFENTEGGGRCMGLYLPEKETCYVHTDHCEGHEDLMDTMIEEVCHHASGATDMSRDFQNMLIKLVARLM